MSSKDGHGPKDEIKDYALGQWFSSTSSTNLSQIYFRQTLTIKQRKLKR